MLLAQINSEKVSLAEGHSNSQIDFQAFVELAKEVQASHEMRQISVDTFVAYSEDDSTIILDSRSEMAYKLCHFERAKHLGFSDFSATNLESIIESKDTRILIFCNNNFAEDCYPFTSTLPSLALSIPTYLSLYAHGYKNIYMLKDEVSVEDEPLEFLWDGLLLR